VVNRPVTEESGVGRTRLGNATQGRINTLLLSTILQGCDRASPPKQKDLWADDWSEGHKVMHTVTEVCLLAWQELYHWSTRDPRNRVDNR
jgi:hypothetical protein